MNGRSARAVPLPLDAGADQIIDWCISTSDLVAFTAALKWIAADDWAAACSRLEHSLLELSAGPTGNTDSKAAERDARGRLVARFHKMQLLKAQDSTRRSNDLTERRRAAVEAEGAHH